MIDKKLVFCKLVLCHSKIKNRFLKCLIPDVNVQEVVEKKGEIEKAFALDERLSCRLDDSGEGTLGTVRALLLLQVPWLGKVLFSFFCKYLY